MSPNFSPLRLMISMKHASRVAVGFLFIVMIANPAFSQDSTKVVVPKRPCELVYFVFNVQVPAKLIDSTLQPDYPEALLKDRIKGHVRAQVLVDTMGRADTTRITILAPDRIEFVDPAIALVRRMRFTPAMTGRKKVCQIMEFPIYFEPPKKA